MEELLTDILREERMNHALEKALRTCPEYQEAEEEAERALEALMHMDLTKEQEDALENCISAYNESTSEYGRAAYRQGFNDGMKLLVEIRDVVRNDSDLSPENTRSEKL